MIALHPWSDDDLPILHKTLGNPAMMEHLGGIETPEQIAARHLRFLDCAASGTGAMFTISLDGDLQKVGTIGFWDKVWRGEDVYETGWMVLPEYGGRGIATQAAIALVQHVKQERRHRFLHAFPSVANVPSNRVCERAGFVNLGEHTFEYPKGHFMQCNDWRFDLD
jgi:RimJ/RimL family protein N-acetyltransferase